MVSALLHVLFVYSALTIIPNDAEALERVAFQEPSAYILFDILRVAGQTSVKDVGGPVSNTPQSRGVVVNAQSAFVQDRASKKVLYEKNADELRAIGSITKLLAAYVFLETDSDLESLASITLEDVRQGGLEHLATGDAVRVRDLLFASLIGSDNSATAALTRLSGESTQVFVQRMNARVQEWGLTQTRVEDPAGLSDENRSTAREVAALLDRVLQHPLIAEATQQSSVTITGASGRVYLIPSTDELLSSFLTRAPYSVRGGKTGYLPEAGYSLGAVFAKEGAGEVIVVALGAAGKQGRFQDVKSLAFWAFERFTW